VDYRQALAQHDQYCDLLRGCGVEVRRLDVNQSYPDGTFIEDTAIVLNEFAVLCSMGHDSRRGEPAGVEPELRQHRDIERIPLPATIEGGDVLRVGRVILVGQSSRTNPAGIECLAEIAGRRGYSVRGVAVHGCLHLKSAVTALPDHSLLVNSRWLDPGGLAGFKIRDVPDQEPHAANVLPLGGKVCLPAGRPHTSGLISDLGFEVLSVDLSEFAKVEGCVTCLSLIIE
jgi:dimethylargininase